MCLHAINEIDFTLYIGELSREETHVSSLLPKERKMIKEKSTICKPISLTKLGTFLEDSQ